MGSFLLFLCFYFSWVWGLGSEENVFNPLELKVIWDKVRIVLPDLIIGGRQKERVASVVCGSLEI